MNDYEKTKLAEYVCNTIEYAKQKQRYNDLCDWINKCGCNIFDFKQAKITENNQKAIQRFLEQLRNQYLKKHSCRSDYERIVCFIGKTMAMSKTEKEYLALIVLNDINKAIEHFFNEVYYHKLNPDNIVHVLSTRCTSSELNKIRLKLTKAGLIEKAYEGNGCSELTSFSKMLFDAMPNTYSDFQRLFLGEKQTSSLKWDDFSHIEKRDEVCALLKEAAAHKIKGINILFYGIPGTGKTEFSRTLARRAGVSMYAVKGLNDDDYDCDDDDMKYRQSALLFAQKLAAAKENVCLLLDEAEDIFYGGKKNKLYLNTMLEENTTPVIWTTNRTEGMDPAFLRRFTYSIRLDIPDEKHCINIWQKILRQNKLPAKVKTAAELQKEYALPPSFIANAAKIEHLIGGGIATVKSSLDNMRELCTGEKNKKKKAKKPTIPFDPALLNTDIDLTQLADSIKKLDLKDFSLCLYGAPGTGKSAYAVWLAERLNRPIIKKRCSDLLGGIVGETEANIRKAFDEAAAKEAILLFDEADSFLQDRRNAMQTWESTLVNEMLTQMENAEHPFICTTNLIDILDQASLRRFTFKVRYDFMTAEQRSKAFATFFGFNGVSLADLENLTPADFALVHKKASILGVLGNQKELLKMLTEEQTIKSPKKFKLGF